MKKAIALMLLSLCLSFTGCAGSTVIYQEMPRPDEGMETPAPTPGVSTALKTGLAIVTDTTDSESADDAEYDVAVVAVLVDDDGVIRSCRVDTLETQLPFDTTGTITGDITAPVQTNNESNPLSDWHREAQRLAEDAAGKTAAQLRDVGAWEDEWLTAVQKAVRNARHLGALEGDELRLAVLADHSDSTSATESEAGRVRLACDAAALTLSGDTITSCAIDSVQADVSFDAMGTITGELSGDVPTKTELGDAYGMKAYGGAKYEWYEQAAHFSTYAVGKTAAEILAIPTADGKPTEAELLASVTISVTPFQRLVAKACGLM